MTMPEHLPWGNRLRDYRKKTGLTQGQFIERLSVLISEIDTDDRSALQRIDVLTEEAAYFNGVLDSPTLSRLEKGNRGLNSRARCIALIWGLNRLNVLTQKDDANDFFELAGHGNLTDAEAAAVLGPVGVDTYPTPVDSGSGDATTSQFGEANDKHHEHHQPSEHESGWSRRNFVAGGVLVVVTALSTLAAALGWTTLQGGDNGSGSDSVITIQQSHRLLMDDIQSEAGEFGRDQSLTSLHEKDQRDDSNDWLRFVKFLPDATDSYFGYQVFHLPDYIPVDSITGIQLDVNYRGPNYEAAPWYWEVEKTTTNERVRLGDNRDSLWWSVWSEASFAFPAEGDGFDASLYVRDGQVWISLTGILAADTLDIDYEVLIVEWTETDSEHSASIK